MADCPVCELHAESVFKIEGMDCHEEVAILEHRLKALAGLEALDADVVGQRLRIQYDAAKLTTSRIAEAVAQTGMRAWLEHEEPRPASASLWRERLVLLAGAFLALWPGAPALGCGTARVGAALRRGGRAFRNADGAPRLDVPDCRPARHPRPDDGRRRGCDRARRVGRGRVGRVPLRARPGARIARDGAGARRDPGADGSGAGRGARPARRRRTHGGHRCGHGRRHRHRPARREDSPRRTRARRREPRQPGADHGRVCSRLQDALATTSLAARSTAVASSTSR